MIVEVVMHGFIQNDVGSTVPAPAQIKEAMADVMAHLKRLKVNSPGVAATAITGAVMIRVTVSVGDEDDALREASIIIRTALHAAGLGTPNWGKPSRGKRQATERPKAKIIKKQLVVA